MAEKTSTATKAASEPGAKGSQHDAPPPVALGLTSKILELQQTTGNRSVGRLLGGVLFQPKLRIGPPGDAYEREADRVADAVLREDKVPASISIVAGLGVQRMCAECEEMLQRSESAGEGLVQRQCHCQDKEELVQRKCHCQEEEELVQPKADAGPAQSTPGLAAQVEALRGSGRPLPADVRSFFEPRFGHDFSAVRIHTGASAAEAARSVNARAFTVGNDVVFETGEWSPETAAGKRLLAHELTHVVQQTPLVAWRTPLLQRATEEGGEAPPQAEEPAISPEEESAAPEEPVSESPAAEGEPSPALVVDDEAETVGPGQMKKGEFFARLRTEVCAAAEAGLAGTEHSARGCPLIQFWLGYYEGQDTERINRDLPRFAGEGPRPTTAEGYISLIAERVRASVATWARTGEITGVPRGLPLPGMGLPGLGSLGGLFGGLGGLGGFGSVLFKAKPGGARDPGDPVALQARLGAGQPLDSSLRSRMESAFGRSFSHVRVHTDSASAGLSAGFNARAFTVGHHVAFGPQEYRPGTMIGDALIAHELAHVAQQGDAGAAGPVRAEGAAYQALERDADLATIGAVASMWTGLRGRLRSFSTPQPRLSSGLRLQRCDNCNGNTRQAAAPAPQVVALNQQASPPRDAGYRWTHPAEHCCTDKMLKEIQKYRTDAAAAVQRAVNALAPDKISSVEPQLQAHFRIGSGDWRLGGIREQLTRMDRSLRQGQVEFRCRNLGDRGTPCAKAGVRAEANNCAGGNGLIWLCSFYPLPEDATTQEFLDSSYLKTMIHEFAHLACQGTPQIKGHGQEIYYSDIFPGDADEAMHQADCYANFALSIR